MIRLLQTNKIRNIGNSNFSPDRLRKILITDDETSQVLRKPAVHEMELHPYIPQAEWLKIHKTLGVNVIAYSPLGNTNPAYNRTYANVSVLFGIYFINDIAVNRNFTPTQVVLAWAMERGTSAITKSKQEQHIVENYASSNCRLKKYELSKIEKIGKGPYRFNSPHAIREGNVDLFDDLDDDTLGEELSPTETEEDEAEKLEALLELWTIGHTEENELGSTLGSERQLPLSTTTHPSIRWSRALSFPKPNLHTSCLLSVDQYRFALVLLYAFYCFSSPLWRSGSRS